MKTIITSCATISLFALIATHYNNSSNIGLSDLQLANVDALAQQQEKNPEPKCDPKEYINDAKEDWKEKEVEDEDSLGIDADVWEWSSVVSVGVKQKTKKTVMIPDCPESTGNCCEKSHLDKEPKTL